MKNIFLLFFIINANFLFSQKKIVQLDRLFDKYSANINKNLDSAFYYCNEAARLNKKIGNEFYESRCLFSYALYYYYLGNPLKSIQHNRKALDLAKKTNNISSLYRIYNLSGALFYESGQFDKAFNEYQKALYYLKILPDNKYYGILFSSLGNLFITKGDTISAIKNYQLCNRYSIYAKDTVRILGSYMCIANAIQNKDYIKANQFYEKAFSLAVLSKDKIQQFNIRLNQSTNFINASDFKRNERGLYHLKMSERLLKQIEDKSLIFYIFFNYGAYYMNKKDFKNSIKYYELANKTYNHDKIPYEQKLDILKKLNNIYKKDGNYQKAYEYQSKFYKLKDSLFSIEKEKNYNQLLAKFEVEKKNGQIQLLSKQNELEKVRKNRLVYISGLALLLLVLSLFFFWSRLRNEKKLSLKQQELNRTRGILEGQSEERNRLAKELHDGVAGSLVGLKLMLYNENEKLKSDKLSTIQNHIDGLYGEIREISHNLSNNFLQDKSFQDLVRNLSERYETRNIFKTEVLFYPEDALNDIDYELKVNLYRIVQEIFTNIQKHAKAENVYFSVTQGEDSVSLIIEDDGIGISENTKEGVGVKNIRERLNLYGGELKIDRNEGKGTSIIIKLKI